MYIFFFKFFSHFGCYIIFSRVPCDLQQVLDDCPFQIEQYIHVNSRFPIPPPNPFALVTISLFSKSVSLFLLYK